MCHPRVIHKHLTRGPFSTFFFFYTPNLHTHVHTYVRTLEEHTSAHTPMSANDPHRRTGPYTYTPRQTLLTCPSPVLPQSRPVGEVDGFRSRGDTESRRTPNPFDVHSPSSATGPRSSWTSEWVVPPRAGVGSTTSSSRYSEGGSNLPRSEPWGCSPDTHSGLWGSGWD